MTTSESENGSTNGNGKQNPQQNNSYEQLNSGSVSPPGFLDVASLTRLANEFMRALPESTDNISATNPDPTGLSNQLGRSNQQVPSEADLRQLPSTLSGYSGATGGALPNSGLIEPSLVPISASPNPTAPVNNSAVAIPGLPGMPGWPGLPGQLSSVPMPSDLSFGFLNDIRSLVPSTNILSSIPTSAAAMPSASSIQSASTLGEQNKADQIYGSAMPTAIAGVPLSAPQMPGAIMHPSVQQGANTYSFSDALQMPRIDVIPVLEPMGMQQLGPLPNLNVSAMQNFDVEAIRRDFPILQQKINGHDLVWLDNAATTQKPQSVIDRLNYFYTHENSNIHRAAHELAARSTDAYEAARESVRRFLNASSVNEIIFVRGATEAINLVAQSWGRQNIQKDDEIVITWLEHHANIVPWQMLCAEKGARLRVAPVDDHGQIILDEYERLLGPRTRLVSLAQVSNALGTVTPFGEMIVAAHRHGAKVLLDGAQAVSHMQVDVQAYDCDFYVFSGHKLFAPTGIGVVYGKSDVLDSMRPWQGGGNMIQDVTFERTTYQPPPLRFEAGTGSIADAVGLGAAIEYLERIGMVNITRHENELMQYGTAALNSIPGLHIIGTAAKKAGVLSFVLDGFRTDEVSSALNQQGIAVRGGHHCAQPILRRFGVESTVRPSLALYNTCEDIDALIAAIWNLKQGRGPGPL
jgi:cysteine desulfurase / selenocysteine lyase